MEKSYVEFNRMIGKRIMAVRLKNNYTREYLAEMADISPKYLYEIEIGKKGCSSYILYRLTDALNVKIEYIMNGENTAMVSNDTAELMSIFTDRQVETIQDMIKLIYQLVQI